MQRLVRLQLADFVAEVFCPSECVRLIQDQASMRNVDSRIHSLRFDCCIFLFYSLSAMTFATQSANRVVTRRSKQRLIRSPRRRGPTTMKAERQTHIAIVAMSSKPLTKSQ